jgi:hypothetical protein
VKKTRDEKKSKTVKKTRGEKKSKDGEKNPR